ncbi:MAG: FHA domain-containing protein, partial [Ilumatobacteraceae bacterium]
VQEDEASPVTVEPEVEVEESPADAVPFESFSLQIEADLSEREPLPIDHAAPNGGDPSADSGPAGEPVGESGPAYERPVMVTGVYSPRGHFNHPDAKYCSRTGVKMGASHTRVLVEGPRPPLGVITLDDGSTHTVQWNLVVGRGPTNDGRVQREEAGPLTIVDDQQSVSRAHAMLELVEWDVLVSDLGSRNHTFVQDGPTAPRRQLAVGERAALRSGTTVHLGERSFVYHEHHVR